MDKQTEKTKLEFVYKHITCVLNIEKWETSSEAYYLAEAMTTIPDHIYFLLQAKDSNNYGYSHTTITYRFSLEQYQKEAPCSSTRICQNITLRFSKQFASIKEAKTMCCNSIRSEIDSILKILE